MRIQMSGVIASDEDAPIYEWCGYKVFSPGAMRSAIRDNPQGETLVVEVNSVGGNMSAGGEIYSLLRAAPCETVCEVQSLAASASSVIPCGADKTLISPVAQFMLHYPSTSAHGNQVVMGRAKQMLESTTAGMLNCYAKKTGRKCTRARLEELCAAETFLSAQDAIKYGLADGYIGGDDGIDARTIERVTACMPQASGELPDFAQLRTAYAAAHPPEGAPTLSEGEPTPPHGTQTTEDKTLLAQRRQTEIEAIRFGGILL